MSDLTERLFTAQRNIDSQIPPRVAALCGQAANRITELEADKETFVAAAKVRRNGAHWLDIEVTREQWDTFLMGDIAETALTGEQP